MKKYNIIALIVLLVGFLATSCEDMFKVDEVDPNNFSDSPSELMINGPMLANDLVVEGELARLANIFTAQFTGADRQYISYNTYNITAGDFDNIWGTLYADGVAQCRIIQEKAQEANQPELEGISMIVEASLIGSAAALWGDVPNTEAGDVEAFPEPKYDSQIDVYNDVIAKLNAAIALVGDATQSSYGSETIDPSITALSWTEVANSLKARYYLHLGQYANALTEATAGISSGAGEWQVAHPGGSYPANIPGSQNIYFDFCAWNRDGYMNADDSYLVELLISRDDSVRLGTFFLEPGWWSGSWDLNMWDMVQYGWGYYGYFDAGEPFPVITYSETQLILAECELLANGDAGAALTALNNARMYWDIRYGSGDGSLYPAYVAADFADNAALLTEILTEKYIACVGQLEAFNDIRRTDNYIGVPVKAGSGATSIPERFIYPQSEINSNDNVPSIENIWVPTKVNEGAYPGI